MIRHRIRLLHSDSDDRTQDEAYFYIQEDGDERQLRFHDYDETRRSPRSGSATSRPPPS